MAAFISNFMCSHTLFCLVPEDWVSESITSGSKFRLFYDLQVCKNNLRCYVDALLSVLQDYIAGLGAMRERCHMGNKLQT